MKYRKGLTLIEILVVVSILTIIISFGLVINFQSFTSSTFLNENAKIVSLLEKARSRAMANMFDTSHGVCYLAPDYIIFRDGTCDGLGTDEKTPANTSLTLTFPSVVFDRISGKLKPQLSPSTNQIDVIVDNGNGSPKHIKINNEGTINW
ncbi:MAG: prepilin-type N-terminal cleavage/methylation domain-containing protein [Patescibacteria group bacterium]